METKNDVGFASFSWHTTLDSAADRQLVGACVGTHMDTSADSTVKEKEHKDFVIKWNQNIRRLMLTRSLPEVKLKC